MKGEERGVERGKGEAAHFSFCASKKFTPAGAHDMRHQQRRQSWNR